MRFFYFWLTVLTVSCAAVMTDGAAGDTVELRDGTLVRGKYAGGTAQTIRIETATGVEVYQTGQVLAVTFSGESPPNATPPTAAPPPVAVTAAPAGVVVVPAGSVFTIRMESGVSSDEAPGTKFTGKLIADLIAGDTTVARAGTTVHGRVEQSEQAGRMAGKSSLAMSLTGIELNGRLQPILTTNFAEAGKGTFRKTARNVGLGALIGHAVDDDGGAGAGAAIGAGVSLIKKGDKVTAPAGAILEFRLLEAFQTPAN